jgi:hypothetical protein
VTPAIEEVFSSMERPFIFEIGFLTGDEQAAATAKTPVR